jgi:hypothetical protein
MPNFEIQDQPGANYSPSPKLYNIFWSAMNKLTSAQPASRGGAAKLDAERRAASFHKVKQNISMIKEFISDAAEAAEKIRKAGGNTGGLEVFLGKLKSRLVVVELAVGATDDAIQAAIEVQTDLSAWYRDAYAKCRTGSDDPFRDDEFICLAAIDRLYQGRNVKAVLGSQSGSFVRRVFDKWKDRLKVLVLPG